ncbi:ABC transporter permease [Cohnella abietis]|uniref:Taurine ABC transporter permease n=1 Tax=Cohnella abietis TaxID=2507935 RepID=A0A3T1D2S5_9BACL|nr:ABC transporter permease [Cohnella abietis]BBI32406.1 taurine ABC transporter permease [Cohnella abietis]
MNTRNLGISLLAVIIAFSAWWIVSVSGAVSHLFLPTPVAVWKAFLEVINEGYKGSPLVTHIGESLKRLAIAFAIALLTAIPIGMLSGYFAKVRAFVDPFIEFYRPLPPLAYYTILVLWLGIGDSSKIALLALAAFAPLYLAVVSGVSKVPKDRINGARSLGAKDWDIFVHVIFPSTLPDLFTGIRTSIGMTYTTLVAAEMVAAVSGMGWMVLDASKFLRSDIIFVGIILMGLIAVLIDVLIRWLEYNRVPWKGKE